MTDKIKYHLREIRRVLIKVFGEDFEDESDRDIEVQIALSRIDFILRQESAQTGNQTPTQDWKMEVI
ncbi:MAG: hypothetical protein GY861_11780 [bacterium]|nr:hypothetical protein [bacterium]